MEAINNSTEEFKKSPLGFLMSVLAKYQAYNQRHYNNSKDTESLEIYKKTGAVLEKITKELAKTEELKKELTNESILVHIVEQCSQKEQEIILESVFEYLNLLEVSLQNTDTNSDDGKMVVEDYYNASRLGLLLNCYLGNFDNDDFFYGIFGHMAEIALETCKTSNSELKNLCQTIIKKVEKADLNLSFNNFLKGFYNSIDNTSRKIVFEQIIEPYAENFLNKVLSQEVTEDDVNALACAKQIQRIYSKLLIQ
ncbi:MAG: hypothetical protein MJ188_09490 [Treponema sp.]|nr:hypothetical protein [Treponema sp.]